LEFREALATADRNVLALILRIQRFPNETHYPITGNRANRVHRCVGRRCARCRVGIARENADCKRSDQHGYEFFLHI
jgi:hypothetical protein